MQEAIVLPEAQPSYVLTLTNDPEHEVSPVTFAVILEFLDAGFGVSLMAKVPEQLAGIVEVLVLTVDVVEVVVIADSLLENTALVGALMVAPPMQ